MIYKYVGNGKFYQGLPAADIDDSLLDDGKKEMLKAGVEAGMYIVQTPEASASAETPAVDAPKSKAK